MRKLGIALLVLLILACSAGAVALTWTAAQRMAPPTWPTATPLPPSPTRVETPAPPPPTAAAPRTATPAASVFDTIARTVEEIRGLRATGPYTRSLMTQAELRAYQERKFEKDYTPEEARQDTLTLAAFDLLPRDF
ncbi:MAG: hypothetical protein RQ891_10550, partial [Thermoflexus sp.]